MPDSTVRELPFDDEAERATFATMRTWDTCALHDPEAAKSVMDGTSASMWRSVHVSGCELAVRARNGSTWTFSISPGAFQDKELNPSQKVQTVAGSPVYRSTEIGCSYQLPFRDVGAIELLIVGYQETSKTEECRLAKQYLAKVLPKWRSPALISEAKTTPVPRMMGQDPCKGLVPIYRELSAKDRAKVRANLVGVAACELEGDYPLFGSAGKYQLDFSISDPADLQDGQSIRVAGLTGVQADSSSSCTYRFGFGSQPISVRDPDPLTVATVNRTVDSITVALPDCRDASTKLTKILGAYQDVLDGKPPAPGPGALRLGDLN